MINTAELYRSIIAGRVHVCLIPTLLEGVLVSVLIRACWRCVWGCGPGVFWSFVRASLCFSIALFHSHPQKLTPTR